MGCDETAVTACTSNSDDFLAKGEKGFKLERSNSISSMDMESEA